MATSTIVQQLVVPANTGSDTQQFENGMRQLYTDIGVWTGEANQMAGELDILAATVESDKNTTEGYKTTTHGYRAAALQAKQDAELAASQAQGASAAQAPLWVSGDPYVKNDVVWNDSTSGLLCRCIQNHSGRSTQPVNDPTYWSVIGREIINLQPQFVGVKETRVTMSGNAIDLKTANLFVKNISGATTFTVTNVPLSDAVASFVLELNGAAGNTITWWAGVIGDQNFNLSSGKDVFVFYTHDGGAEWIGMQVAEGL